jgi:carboxyl-terminal processing protease
MSSRTRWLVFAVSTPLVLFVSIGGILGATAREQASFSHLKVLTDVVDRIMRAYVEPADPDKFMDGAMRGLADGLDPSSAFLTPEEVQAVTAKTPLPAGDTGLSVTRQFYVRVVGVRDGSPAARAGLRTGDFLRMIDGKATRDMSALAGSRLLRGAPGSKVSLLVLRGSAAEPHLVDLVRETPTGDLVTGKRLPSGEGYIRVVSFESGAAAQMRKQVEALQAAGADRLLLDIRGIADGTLDEGIAAARLFVKTGAVATLGGRGTDKKVTAAAAGDGSVTLPMVVLVSNGTANAAEVFAAALQGNKRAELAGEPTIGLAAVQKLVALPEGRGMWLTYARYLTVDGAPIHEHGLRPDVAVEEPSVAFGETAPPTDEMLTRAIDRLKMLLIKK